MSISTDWFTRAALLLCAAVLFAAPTWATSDADADGVADAADNCPAVANFEQYDVDLDGVGNACDTDYDNDGATTQADADIIQAAMGTMADDPGFDARADHDGDGQVLTSDFRVFLEAFRAGPDA